MDLWDDIARRAAKNHGVISVYDLVRSGASRSQVQRWRSAGRLVSYGYGAFMVAGAPPTYAALVKAAIEEFPNETWASHRSAARLHGLRMSVPEGLVEVTRPTGLSAERGMAIVHRSTRIPRGHVTVVCGVPCLTVPRTLFDLARTTPAPVLLRVLDGALIDHRCTIGSVWRAFHELGGRGRPGTKRMREVLEWLGADYVPPSSELEAVGMALLAGEGFEWQVEISDERGYVRRVDGFDRGHGVVVEFDGPQHHREPQRSNDQATDLRLAGLGLEVVRLGWDDVTVCSDAALEVIERARAQSAA